MSVYDPLQDYLSRCGQEALTLRFDEVEAILHRPLPPSAYTHGAWWNNEGGNPRSRHVHARAWYRAGCRAEADLAARTVCFVRESGIRG